MGTSFLSSEEYDEKAHRHYDAGEYDEALDVLREGLVHHPESVLLHVGVGYVRVAREEYVWARQCFEQALELDPSYEDAWVGLGETLLKFGRVDEALACFSSLDEMGLRDDLELGLTVGRALYREGLFAEARQRFQSLTPSHPDSAELAAARAYTLHALGDDLGARRELRRAIRLDGELWEARIYLAHLLYDRGDHPGALRELEKVPPAEHWDTLSLWRYLDLKSSLEGAAEDDARLAPWRERLNELDTEPDEIDHLLAEVEASFEGAGDPEPDPEQKPGEAPGVELAAQIDYIMRVLQNGESGSGGVPVHRVRTAEGSVFEGTWEQIVGGMRDRVAPGIPVATFMRRTARQVRERTGGELPCDSAEAFVRAGARMGLLHIET